MENGTAPNAKRLLWAGFFSIFAAGVGFGVRGAILLDWGQEYGFTQAELGEITGGGLTGFGIIIILGSLIADHFGYGKLMVFAVIMHVLSAALQLCSGLIFQQFGTDGVYWSLFIAMFMFSIANGTCEVVVNPMVAALFPKQKTHYLNILHAGWPGGLVTGGLIGYFFSGQVHWIIQMSLFLVPVAIYGVMLIGQHLPRSEARQSGINIRTMLAEFAAPVLLLLLLIHAMVGYVELGTDSWIQKITGSIMDSRGAGMLLFVYTSGLMFTLRFFAGPIEGAISPLGLLFASAVFASLGLLFLGNAVGIIVCVLAATVYGIGKTFFWPTMLAVVSERFPRGGAVTLGAVGGVGMLSAGFLGGPGIGVTQDYYASAQLKTESADTYVRYAAEKPNYFLGFIETRGLDGTKVGMLDLAGKQRKNEKKAAEAAKELDALSASDARYKELEETAKDKQKAAKDLGRELDTTLKKLGDAKDEKQKELVQWWEKNGKPNVPVDAKPVDDAGLYGGRMALLWTAIVPAVMAVLYLLLIMYFRVQGGYGKVHLERQAPELTPR